VEIVHEASTAFDRSETISGPIAVARMIEIMAYAAQIVNDLAITVIEHDRIETRARRDIDIVTRSRSDARAVVEFAHANDKSALARAYLDRMLSIDRDDPLFLYLAYRRSAPKRRDLRIKKLRKIERIAMGRNDHEALALIRAEIQREGPKEPCTPYPDMFGDGGPFDMCDDDVPFDEEELLDRMKSLFTRKRKTGKTSRR
jgi:hypothetical protein